MPETPWEFRAKLGQRVRDEAIGRTGVLADVLEIAAPRTPGTGFETPRSVHRQAFIRPEGGGREWATAPESLTFLDAEGDSR